LNLTASRLRVVLALGVIAVVLALAAPVVVTEVVWRRAATDAGAAQDEAREAVLKVLRDQEAAWNRGDLDRFMSGYWRSDDLTFYSGGDVQHGWQATYDRYRKTYQAEGKEMGSLTFDQLLIDPTGPTSALVRGRWQLTFSDGKTAGGLFTLLFREEPQGWCVVHDHTSKQAPPEVPLPQPGQER
jgi:beta-aspartyl-peptidase (threonine type)